MFWLDKNLWLSQKLLSKLYDVERSVITKHLLNIYDENELEKGSTCAKFAQVEIEDQREITRQYVLYSTV